MTIEGSVVGTAFQQLIFSQEDINQAIGVPAKLLRTIFVKRGITYADLYNALKREELKMGRSPNKISEQWGNLKPAIKKKTITYQKLSYVFALLQWKIDEISFTIESEEETGENKREKYSVKF